MVNTAEDIDTYRPEIRWGLRDVGAAVAAVFVGVIIVLVGLRVAVGALDGLDSDDVRPWGLAAVEGLMILAVWVFAVRRRGASRSSLGMRSVGPRAMYLLPLAVFILSLTLTAAYVGIVSGLGLDFLEPPELTEDLLGTGVQRVVTVIAIVLWGPFAEELFFRGFVLAALVGPLGPFRAAVASSALFAVAHVSIGVVFPIFVTGMLLAWLYLRTRSIWPPMTAHALQNFIAVSVIA